MNADEVVNKIRSEAESQADDIKTEALAKVKAEESKLNEELAAFTEETERIAKEASEDKKARMLATARMQIAKEYLAAKQQILNKVFELAQIQVTELPDAKYIELMSELVAKAVDTGDEEIIPGQQETRIDSNFIKQINRKLGPGFKGNLRLSTEKAKISGGFILRRGKIQTNVSVEVLVEQAKQGLAMEIATSLFE